MKSTHDLYLGIDLGTSTIKVAVARMKLPPQADNRADLLFASKATVEFLGLGEAPALSMVKGEPEQPGIVTEQLYMAVKEALESARLQEFPHTVALALSGAYLETLPISATIEIPGSLPITEDDMVAVTRKVYDLLTPQDGTPSVVPYGKIPLTSVLPRCYRLADDRIVFSPIDQISSKLTCDSLYFALDTERSRRIFSMVDLALNSRRIDCTATVPVALSCALWPPMKLDNNLPLPLAIDLGAGLTSLAMPSPTGGLIAEQIAVGCDHLANDLSLVFNLKDINTARDLVKKLDNYRCTAIPAHDGDARRITILSPDGTKRDIAADDIEMVIEARLKELFSIIAQRIEENQATPWLDSEILLTGDGALIPRITELAGTILKRKVRVGTPYQVDASRFFETLPPRFTTLCGLFRVACQERLIREAHENQKNLLDRLAGGVRKAFQALFRW
ncbi:MAG: hypothetical protein J6Y80_04905 [Victivallales bacterium]|nr:hypothetical protein [Victivallales bacterium]